MKKIFENIKNWFVNLFHKKMDSKEEEQKQKQKSNIDLFNDYVISLIKSKKPFLALYSNENEKIELSIKEEKKSAKKD